jgi:hypothetical protein
MVRLLLTTGLLLLLMPLLLLLLLMMMLLLIVLTKKEMMQRDDLYGVEYQKLQLLLMVGLLTMYFQFQFHLNNWVVMKMDEKDELVVLHPSLSSSDISPLLFKTFVSGET